MKAIRQHLIDPEICIRCNTCEETCPVDAITHDDNNYVVMADKCEYCMDCIAPCPTGAIDNWRKVLKPYPLDEQYGWDELPEEREAEVDDAAEGESDDHAEAVEADASEILAAAHAGGGRAVPPHSAAQPFINLYTRERPATARVMGNYRITDAHSESDIRHIVLDFGATAFPVLEGQSIGIIPPGTDDHGKPCNVRLYSVASPRDGERPNHNNLSLTVKRVTHDADGNPRPGIGSNYVCNLQKGDEVQVTGPFGATFLMPSHPGAKLIMICTGTGSAPFRAMTERRRRRKQAGDSGRILLFFGARTPGELPYFGPLSKLPDSLIEKELVFSRCADQPKEYVQQRMLQRGDDLAALLQDDDSYLYICGLKGMESGVNEALASICRGHGMDWEQLRGEMRAAGRFHVETY